jgi:hypothetical protein
MNERSIVAEPWPLALLEAAEVHYFGDFHVIVAVGIHRFRASWRAVRR